MLRWLFRKTQAEEELDAELRSYIDHAVDGKVASGLTPEEARRAALIEFGGVEQVKERVRTIRAGARIDAAIADCRFALRALHRRPSFATIAILTIALGIGAATAMFAVVDNVLLRPLKHKDSERLVTVWGTVAALKADTVVGDFWNRFTVSYEDYQDWLNQQTVFEDTAIFAGKYARFAGEQETRTLSTARASGNFFALLGTRFFRGRSFEADEKEAVVVTYEFWNKALGADP